MGGVDPPSRAGSPVERAKIESIMVQTESRFVHSGRDVIMITYGCRSTELGPTPDRSFLPPPYDGYSQTMHVGLLLPLGISPHREIGRFYSFGESETAFEKALQGQSDMISSSAPSFSLVENTSLRTPAQPLFLLALEESGNLVPTRVNRK